MDQTRALDVEGLEKTYGELRAVSGISLSLARGEILGQPFLDAGARGGRLDASRTRPTLPHIGAQSQNGLSFDL